MDSITIVENCLSCELRTPGVLCDLPVAVLQNFNSIKYAMEYPKGVTLFSQGQPARGIFIMCQGHARLSLSSVDGARLILRFTEPGEALGLSSAMLSTPYPMTAETVDVCQVNFIKRSDFLKLVRSHKEACYRFAERLGEQCISICDEIRFLALSRSAEERLARLLLQWSEGKRGRAALITSSATHDEIAEMIGTSRETVTRLLADLRRKHAIQFAAGRLTVDRSTLSTIARHQRKLLP